jgi:tetratricopeptide (TPR) repeat protein
MTLPDHIQHLLDTQELESARREMLAHLDTNPQDPDLLYEIACVHDRLGLESEAAPYYEAAIRRGLQADSLRGAYLGLGSTYRCLGRYEEADRTFQEGLALFPNALELRVFRAMCQYNLGADRDAVAALLEVVVDTSTDPAIQEYERAIRLYAQDLDRTWG